MTAVTLVRVALLLITQWSFLQLPILKYLSTAIENNHQCKSYDSFATLLH